MLYYNAALLCANKNLLLTYFISSPDEFLILISYTIYFCVQW